MKREELDLAIRVATLDLIENLEDAAPFGTYVMAETHAFYIIELTKRWSWDQINGHKLKISRAIQEANTVTQRHFRNKDAAETTRMIMEAHGYTEEEVWPTPQSMRTTLETIQKEEKSEKSPSATDAAATSTETSPSTTTATPSDSGKDSEPTAPSVKQKKRGKKKASAAQPSTPSGP